MIGETVSHYRVLHSLGHGGMGVVYEAEDLLLGRRIALKLLAPEVAGDAGRRQRFEREARAIASLNHPNIVTVYSIEQIDGHHLITMELVNGRTLAAALPLHGFPLKELLAIAVQVADALTAAHERGVTHRDLKPANVMLAEDGRVKVLDFGLAKLRAPAEVTSMTTQPLTDLGLSGTEEGHVVGTTAYMSPEQAEGRSVDERSDIFSFGVLLHEIATGERPFTGDSKVSVIASILKDNPRFLTECRAELPVEFARIVRRCLQKERKDRYQSARDLLNELTELRQESESGDVPFQRSAVRPVRWYRWAAGGAGVLAIAGLAAWIAFRTPGSFGRGDVSVERAAPAIDAPVPATSAPGAEGEPALSPDGSFVAFSSDENGNPDIFLATSGGGRPVPLAPDPATDEKPAWFPDGTRLAFASDRNGHWDVWNMGSLGDALGVLVANARDPAIAPDGKRVAFTRTDAAGDWRVMVAPLADTSSAKRITQGTGSSWQSESDPAWSPDGRNIAYFANRTIWVVPAAGGTQKHLLSEPAFDVEPVWLDDRTITFSSLREGTWALWWARTDEGVPRRLTRGAGPERHPSVAADRSRLAFSTYVENTDLWTRDLRSSREFTAGGSQRELSPSFSPDGLSLCYVKSGSIRATTELWLQRMAPDGSFVGQGVRLSEQEGAAGYPDVSPDGRRVAYQLAALGHRHIWMIPLSGSNVPVQLTFDEADDTQPSWSPDGRAIAFSSTRSGSADIWVLPIRNDGPAGAPVRVASGSGNARSPVWRPDGREIAYVVEGEPNEVWVTRSDGRAAPRRVTKGAQAWIARWHPNGKELLVSGTFGESRGSIRRVDAATGAIHHFDPPIWLTQPSSNPMFDIRADGRVVAFSRARRVGDIYVARVRAPGSR